MIKIICLLFCLTLVFFWVTPAAQAFRVNHPHKKVCTDSNEGKFNCHARVITDQKDVAVTNAVPIGYGPTQFKTAYQLTENTNSAKPIIAVVDAYNHPRILADLNTYSDTFGIPRLPACAGPIAVSPVPCFLKVNQNGGTTTFLSTNRSWALEIAMDVEVAHAICQSCKILLVEANSSSYSNLMAAVDRANSLGASVISNSYGSGEFSTETQFDSHFNKPGVVFTFSTGDGGYGAEYPAASQFVTAVGGTTLNLNPDNSYGSESVWAGTGSGCSLFEPKPIWQTDPLCNHRTIADVSADADPNTGAAVFDSVSYFGQSGWFQVGGTSLGSPIIAASYALAGGVGVSVKANSVPYSNPAGLHDILSGSNGSCGNYLCNASTGYDGPTGLGSPNGLTAF